MVQSSSLSHKRYTVPWCKIKPLYSKKNQLANSQVAILFWLQENLKAVLHKIHCCYSRKNKKDKFLVLRILMALWLNCTLLLIRSRHQYQLGFRKASLAHVGQHMVWWLHSLVQGRPHCKASPAQMYLWLISTRGSVHLAWREHYQNCPCKLNNKMHIWKM